MKTSRPDAEERVRVPPPPDDTRDGIPPLPVDLPYGNTRFRADLRFQTYINNDMAGLNRDMAEQAQRAAFWGYLESRAKAAYEDANSDLEALEAELFLQYYAQLTSRGERGRVVRPMIEMVRSKVTLDPRRRELEYRVRKLKQQTDLLTAGRRSMEHRKDALVTIGANLRGEAKDGQIVINKRAWAKAQEGR